jgi:hypothetical protein
MTPTRPSGGAAARAAPTLTTLSAQVAAKTPIESHNQRAGAQVAVGVALGTPKTLRMGGGER